MKCAGGGAVGSKEGNRGMKPRRKRQGSSGKGY